MKKLSTWLAMKEGYPIEQFHETIIEWLKAGPPSKEVGERFKTHDISKPTVERAGYCTLEFFPLTKESTAYYACKLTHIYREQTWVTEIILEAMSDKQKVYINVECQGDTTRFNEIPTVRTDVIRAFIQSGWVKETILPITAEPIMLTGKWVDVLANAINGNYKGSLPIVYISKLFDRAGYIVDAERLAKDLAGIAIIIAEENDTYLEELKERTGKQNPYNGHISNLCRKYQGY